LYAGKRSILHLPKIYKSKNTMQGKKKKKKKKNLRLIIHFISIPRFRPSQNFRLIPSIIQAQAQKNKSGTGKNRASAIKSTEGERRFQNCGTK
jgi:hypothetical protein